MSALRVRYVSWYDWKPLCSGGSTATLRGNGVGRHLACVNAPLRLRLHSRTPTRRWAGGPWQPRLAHGGSGAGVLHLLLVLEQLASGGRGLECVRGEEVLQLAQLCFAVFRCVLLCFAALH